MSLENFKPKRRLFKLKSGKTPVAYKIRTSSNKQPLLVVNLEEGTQREIRFASNMASPFMDEQEGKGTPILEHVWLRKGVLAVSEKEIALQKFLLVHPDNVANGGKIFYEVKPEEDAKQAIVNLEAAANAMAIAKDFDIDDASAIVFSQVGRRIDRYNSSEIKRDLLTLALNNAPLFLELADDEGVKLAWTAHQAIKFGVLTEQGKSVFFGKSKKKLLTVKASETASEAVAKFFVTDDGIAALEEVKAKLSKLLS